MRRRALLSATVAGVSAIAGCTGLLGDSDRSRRDQYDVPARETATATATDSPTPTPRPTATTTGDDDGVREVDPDRLEPAVELGTGSRAYGLSRGAARTSLGLSVRAGFAPGASDPPVLVVAVTNESPGPTVVPTDRIPMLTDPVGGYRPGTWGDAGTDAPSGSPTDAPTTSTGVEVPDARSSRQGLALVPTPESDLPGPTVAMVLDDGYWRLEQSREEWIPDRVGMDAGATVLASFRVVGTPGLDGRPTGVYRFGTGDRGFRIVVWNAERPGPTEPSRFENAWTVAPRDRPVQWFHEADATTTTYLRPGRERTDLPASVEFEFVNRSQSAISGGGWQLFKEGDAEWFRVYPFLPPAGVVVVRPGGTVRRTVRAFHGPVDARRAGSIDVGHLGGGRYAMTIGHPRESDASAALVEVDAGPVEVVPHPSVEATGRGEEVLVTSPRIENATAGPARVAVSRWDALVLNEYVAEQVMQPYLRILRNTLPFFEEGVERVVLSTDHVPPLSTAPFRFQGETYRVDPVDGG